MDQRTGADRYFDEQLQDPEYRVAYESAKPPSLWRLRWMAWRNGVPVRDLWGIASFYRELRRVPSTRPKRPNPTIEEPGIPFWWFWVGAIPLGAFGIYVALRAGGVLG